MSLKSIRMTALAATLLAGTATFAYAQTGSSSIGAGGPSAKHGASSATVGGSTPSAAREDDTSATKSGEKAGERKAEQRNEMRSGTTAQGKAASDMGKADAGRDKSSTSGTGASKAETAPGKANSATGASGKTTEAGAKVNLTAEQKTQIKNTIVNNKSAPRVTSVNFNVSVGTAVPTTVRFAPVPETIVRIHPAWRGYDYFVYNDEVIIIEPKSHKIVEVIVVS